MRLPKNILTGNYTKPRIFLCETDKEKICQLETTNTSGSFKFNAYSELSFEVGRFYNDIITGQTLVNPYYDKIEALRLIYLENIGYFEIQGPELIGDGIKEEKNITAYSLEYTLSQKYLEDFYINTGEVNSVEVINASSENDIVPVTLYNPANKKLSLLHLVLEKVYGWTIGHVDSQLKTLSRQFEVERESVYDFLMNEICEKFNCYIEFDTIKNEINVFAESPTAKFIGDGVTNTFTIGNVGNTFSEVKTVSIDGYKTSKWAYGFVDKVGTLVLTDTPKAGSMVEVVGVDATWDTDVFVTFDNLSQEIKVNYSADDIKTVLTVKFGEDNDIREVNLGLPYIVDLSYYTTPDWMGQDLYDAWIKYQQTCASQQSAYSENSKKMLEYADKIDYEQNRLSLGYARATVNETTVGTYYVRGGDYPNYYYTEVSLPADYNVNTKYYSTKTCNLEDGKEGNVMALYTALQKYFMNTDGWKTELEDLSESFDDFMGPNAIVNLTTTLANIVPDERIPAKDKDGNIIHNTATEIVSSFLNIMWNEVGRMPLKQLYADSYYQLQITGIDAGWSSSTHAEYKKYYTIVLFTNSLDYAIEQREIEIDKYQQQYNTYAQANVNISNSLLMSNNFTPGQLIRLSAFLREDELQLDDIVTTAQDSLADTFKNQQDALEVARIELDKISKPQLQFSMSMANIYALPEFEPIIGQFQLGNIIKVGLRPDYVKQSRLMQVNINFDDFSDFSCEFGELTNLRSQSDIHADLLKNAITAGKSVAQNASYWSKGSDIATSTDLKIQQGLLDAVDAIKSTSGQSVSIDKYGIHLRKEKDGGGYDNKQGWIVNNQLLFSDDGFKTARSALGEFEIDGTKYYGLIAEAVLSGYIESTHMRGGTIKIGAQKDSDGNSLLDESGNPIYALEIDETGSVKMGGGTQIVGYATDGALQDAVTNTNTLQAEVEQLKQHSTVTGGQAPTNPTEGQMWLDTTTDPYTLKIYNNGQWVYFDQQTGNQIHTSSNAPINPSIGDLWVLPDGVVYNNYTGGSILKATTGVNNAIVWVDAMSKITQLWSDIGQTFEFNRTGANGKLSGVTIGQSDDQFKVNINSENMQFYGGDTPVVHIGHNSANIDNLTVEQNFVADCPLSMFKGAVGLEKTVNGATKKYQWIIEDSDGSLSLVANT